jgi:hypothetical protein
VTWSLERIDSMIAHGQKLSAKGRGLFLFTDIPTLTAYKDTFLSLPWKKVFTLRLMTPHCRMVRGFFAPDTSIPLAPRTLASLSPRAVNPLTSSGLTPGDPAA